MHIGTRIKKLRKNKGWSQDKLCQQAGLKREYLSRVENEHTTPALATLSRIAAALQISLSQLVDIPGEEEYESDGGNAVAPGKVAQPQAGYQVLPQDVDQEIENAVEELCSELKRRIRAIFQRRNF